MLSKPSQDQKSQLYVLETYRLENGAQPGQLHEWLRDAWLPAHNSPALVMDALVAPHLPQVAAIRGYASFEEWLSVRERTPQRSAQIFNDAAHVLLQPTRYSPDLIAGAGASPRIFELRLYHSPTWPQLEALHERFAGPEIAIFHRLGIRPILYTSTLAGPHVPNLVYVTPFADLAERERAWAAFLADPEWIRVKQESIDRGGQISQTMQISLYRAAAYSPIR